MAIDPGNLEQTLERLSENDRMLEHRMTVLETRWDAILPTLATKVDVAELKVELKDDLHNEMNKLSRWLLGLTVTMLFGFAGMIITMINLLRP